MSLSLTSTAFAHEDSIPVRYTCEGRDLSPPLSWIDIPEGTKSLVLIMDDPDAPDPAAAMPIHSVNDGQSRSVPNFLFAEIDEGESVKTRLELVTPDSVFAGTYPAVVPHTWYYSCPIRFGPCILHLTLIEDIQHVLMRVTTVMLLKMRGCAFVALIHYYQSNGPGLDVLRSFEHVFLSVKGEQQHRVLRQLSGDT
ncbi:MAG: hypothetical protein KAJ98_02035 [Spirochaetaceae bacterium]|nr:hypothetical protein [Spirochaetaceae bacterium]